MPTWGQALSWGIAELNNVDARADCLRLLTDNTSYNLLDVYKIINEEYLNFSKFQADIVRRKQGEPVAYITGRQDFWQQKFYVNQNVLIPRPESELIISTIKDRQIYPNNILELGVGSGAIIISYLLENKNICGFGSDVSQEALLVAKKNMLQLQCHNLTLKQGSWYEPWHGVKFDVIISNPPYIAENDLHLEQLTYEPQNALISGADGLKDLRKIIANAKQFIAPKGWILLEHGYNQKTQVAELLLEHNWHKIENILDLNNRPRVTLAQAP